MNTDVTPLSNTELFEKVASQALISEANQFRTVSAGTYLLRKNKHDAYVADGRTIVDFRMDIIGQDGKKKASAKLSISPDVKRTANGYLDGKAKLFGQLTRALWPTESNEQRASHSLGEIVETLGQTPIDGYVALTFRGPKDPVSGQSVFVDAGTPEEEVSFRSRGYEPMNLIRSVQPVK